MLPGRVDVGLLFHNVNYFLQVFLCIYSISACKTDMHGYLRRHHNAEQKTPI